MPYYFMKAGETFEIMSDTPRTDAAAACQQDMIGLCRTLERELAEKDRKIIVLQTQINLALDSMNRTRKRVNQLTK